MNSQLLRLLDLDPTLIRLQSEKVTVVASDLRTADGILFLCPKCYLGHGRSPVGVHRIKCWRPHVPPSHLPGPGRWEMFGTSVSNLSLKGVGKASSVLLTSGCAAHFHVSNGLITFC